MGDTTREEYEEYVTDCSYYGFDVDYDKGENYYRAYNEDGYYLSLSYEGNNIMLIRIDEPQKGAEAAAGTENVTEETAKQEVEETVAESRTEEIATESETEEQQPAMDSDTSTVGEDGCEFPYKSRVMGTSEPLKPLKAPYMARNPVKWGFFRLKGQEIPLKI